MASGILFSSRLAATRTIFRSSRTVARSPSKHVATAMEKLSMPLKQRIRHRAALGLSASAVITQSGICNENEEDWNGGVMEYWNDAFRTRHSSIPCSV